ncbi:hypothetical protein [Hymenobacter sp. PAMC 26628]|uniref:hypothetical protein n=1 Tax=Hymenobacter sp. PAMC 26628 TaxID=1484118 RepID=UPI000A716B23|nr:hypothetical protein [Hymenobacter sp. PAMC 26628]
MYPLLKKNWYSRGCSGYWQFSNDTVSFYVKIDTKKTPQFPIDENYYLDKHIEGIDLVMSCYKTSKEDEKYISSILTSDPIYFVDSIKIMKAELAKYEPSQIAILTVYKDKSATDILGGEGVNGLIYIETKEFARKRYWRFFKSKSRKYFNIVPQPGLENDIIYILNGKVLQENFEGDLSAIDDTNFVEISILNKQNLINNLSIANKRWGISIRSKLITNKTIK